MLADRLLAAPEQPPAVSRSGPDGPGFMEWDGTKGTLTTPPCTQRPTTWDAYLRESGLDPAEVEVIEPVGVRGWQVQRKADDGSTSLVWAHYYKLNVVRRRPGPGIDDLLARVKRAKPRKARPAEGATFLVATGDQQLAKVDGDGVSGTVDRTMLCLADAAERYKALRRQRAVGPVHIAWLGDGCEGFVSQGGDNAWRTALTLTEQTRLLRRIMLHAAELFAPLTDSLTQVCVPGNHDQAVRFGKGGVTRYDDSHDVESLIAVADALRMNSDAYGHVRTFTPDRDELTVTTETSGTILTHAHGHMWRPGKHFDWWQGQSFGDLPSGRADVLLSAHGHHLHIEQRGKRTFVMVPALESRSQWWVHRTGQLGNPGIFTATVDNGGLGNVHVV